MVLVYINSTTGLSKAALETVTYGKKLGGDVTVITNGAASNDVLATLGEYGAAKVLVDRSVDGEDPQQLARLIAAVADQVSASAVIFSPAASFFRICVIFIDYL